MNASHAAKLLGGESIRAESVLCPGPGHSPRDRSLHVTFASTAPEGFLVRSYANDDFGACRDYVRDRLRLQRPPRKSETVSFPQHAAGEGVEISTPIDPDPERQAKTRLAVAIWRESVDPRGTLVERYFRVHREGLDLPHELCGRVLRFNPACPWRDGEAGRTIRVPAMVAAMRDIHSNEPRAVHRTRLDDDGRKVDRRWLGDALGCAIKLDPDDTISAGLALGEGIETCQAARQLGIRPCWATGSVSTIGTFPVLSGIECLTLLGESDKKGANAWAVAQVGARWVAAEREVVVVKPEHGDVDDVRRRAAR